MEQPSRDTDKFAASANPLGDQIGSVLGEVQLLLAEKRTSLASLRTGIAVFVLPLSVLSVLVATSKYYDVVRVLHFLIPLLGLCLLLVVLGAYLVVVAVRHIHKYDRLIRELKRKHSSIANFIQ